MGINRKRSGRSCVVSMTGDPVTIGHRDVIERASRIFDRVYVLVSRSSAKPGRVLDYEGKVRTITADLKADCVRNFSVLPIEGATVDQAKRLGAKAIVRGLRNEQDLVYETDMSAVNRMLCPGVETIYLPCKPELSFVSSSMVRELVRLGKYAEAAKFTSDRTVGAMKRMLTAAVGITGGIACGKSEVQKEFKKAGWAVIDCDDVNRMLLRSDYGEEVVAMAKGKYGVDVSSSVGYVNAKKLANLVFSNPAARIDLQKMSFPLIAEYVENFAFDDWKANPNTKVAVQVPLLFEPGAEAFVKMFSKTVCVSTSRDMQAKRMKERRGYSDEEIESRLASQMDLDEKERRCDYVIPNTGSLRSLRERVVEVIREIEEKL